MIPLLFVAIVACVGCGLAAVLMPQLSPGVRLPSAMGQRQNPLLDMASAVGSAMRTSQPGAGPEATDPIYAGSRVTIGMFRGLKVLSAAGGCALAAIVGAEVGGVPPMMWPVAGVIGFVLPDMWLRSKKGARQRAILRQLPEIVDLLGLCLGAGLDFLVALNKVVSLRQAQKEPLIEELALTLQEIKLGKRRVDALKAMSKRLKLAEISSFVRTVVQADRMGTPITEVLAVHAEDVRMQRMERAERAALKAPMKILVPLIFFIMPCVAIIVGAPVFIQFMRQSPFGK